VYIHLAQNIKRCSSGRKLKFEARVYVLSSTRKITELTLRNDTIDWIYGFDANRISVYICKYVITDKFLDIAMNSFESRFVQTLMRDKYLFSSTSYLHNLRKKILMWRMIRQNFYIPVTFVYSSRLTREQSEPSLTDFDGLWICCRA